MDILGMGKAIDLVRDILAPVGSTASDVWGALVGDRVALWRVKNSMQYRPMLAAEAERLGLTLNSAKIPEKFAFSWFEQASKQDEEDIQLLFARLLARAADESAVHDPDRRLIDVLSGFTCEDAALFQRIYSDRPFPDTGAYSEFGSISSAKERGYPADWLTTLLGGKDDPGVEVSLDNLARLNCLIRQERFEVSRGRKAQIRLPPKITHTIPFDIASEIRSRSAPRTYYIATKLGQRLYDAVKE